MLKNVEMNMKNEDSITVLDVKLLLFFFIFVTIVASVFWILNVGDWFVTESIPRGINARPMMPSAP